MADADATAATDLAALIAAAPAGDGAAPDAERAKQLRSALKRAHDRALARSRAAAASAALLGDHRRGAQVSELVLGDAETVWQQLRLRGRDGDRHAVAAEHYLQRQAEAVEGDESDGDEDEEDDAADDEAAADAESESASSSASSSSEEEDNDAEEEEDEDEWADDVDEDDDDQDEHEGAGIAEDRFFSLAGMEEFVAEDEAIIAAGPSPENSSDDDSDEDESDESDDGWAGSDDEEYGRTAKYADFFDDDQPKKKKKSINEKHRKDIEALEQDHVVDPSERPWELRGEVQGKDRPRNSLLGLDATWDGVSKDPPPLDAAFGLKIEEVIKERVLSSNFDDIVPQTVVEQAYRERRSGKVEEDDDGALGQKSKLGLSEEYEKDYVERQEAGEKSDKPVRDEALDEKWRKLASRLDALSHFASPLERPALDEEVVAARTKASAVQLEEATPAAHTTNDGLAPEEVRAKKRGRDELQRSQEEATRDERKAQRLAKKKARNAKRKKLRADARIVAKVAPDLKNPYEAKRVVRRVQQASESSDQGKYGRSGKFFEQLQEEVRREVRGGNEPAPKRKKPARASAAKLG
jgi:U3 small nucleolar RNA-associated protein MPP10